MPSFAGTTISDQCCITLPEGRAIIDPQIHWSKRIGWQDVQDIGEGRQEDHRRARRRDGGQTTQDSR
jgi:hypothetical protein